MNFAAEQRVDPEDQTQCVGSFPPRVSLIAENSHSTIEYLVAIRQNRQLIKVFRPREKNITFGRSSHCSITLPDPRFSRKAGEIVLGPVPILRRYRNGEENGEIIPIHPGKPFRFRPYTFTLMESGDVFFNRNKKSNGRKTGLLKSILFIIAVLGAGTMLVLHQGIINVTADTEQGSASSSVVSEQNRDEIIIKQKNKKSGEDIETQRLASSEPLTEKQIAVTKVTSGNFTPTPPRNERVTPTVRRQAERKNREVVLEADVLKKVIKTAVKLIERGDLKMAGRTLLPLMPHIDNKQQRRVIDNLDPPVQSLFQKAYMIKPYEPGRSREILQRIVESGLTILPSYGKAKKMLEGERSSMSGDPFVDK